MNWAISNLTGGNRVSRAILVRYSAVPDAESVPQTPSSSSSVSAAASAAAGGGTTTSSAPSSFAVSLLHAARHVPGTSRTTSVASGSTVASRQAASQISLPLDVEETVTCFCRKARRKERDGDQNSTDTKLYLEESVLERKLPEADLKALVDLPAGLDYNEWLASHTLALFEHVNLVYGTISEFCTPSGCADMTGPGNRTYLWFDEKGKKTRVAAPQYIDYVLTFTQKTVSDESIFPTKYANEFPSSFESIARKILRLQFHVIAHLYAAHFREIALLGLHTHLNLTFAHLTALHRRFTLIDEKETDVLRDLEVALRLTDDTQAEAAAAAAAAEATASSLTNTAATTHCSSAALSNSHHASTCGGGGGTASASEEVNFQQTTAAALAAAALIDGDSAAPPICTQPEATTKASGVASNAAAAAAAFAGGGGLIGGILGDLSSGEFGDTTRYCTSAVPSFNSSAVVGPAGVCCDAATAAATANSNNGAGALHLNFTSSSSNNNNNNHHLHHHNNHHHHQPHLHHPNHHHHAHHQHHLLLQQQQLQHQQQQQQNSGLIQCNASTAPSANAAVAASTPTASGTTTTA